MKDGMGICLAAWLLLVACEESIDRPDSTCACELDFSAHPRAPTYQKLLDRYVGKGLPGLVLLVDSEDDGLWIGAGGEAAIEDSVAMTACHVHHGASLAKTYLATLTLLLAERGDLDLDAPIREFLPSRISDRLPNGKRTSIRQLMNHTSGIPEYNDQPDYLLGQFNDPLQDLSTGDRIGFVFGLSPLAEPGAQSAYADTNYLLLSLVVDSVTGDHAAELARSLFEPLELDETYYHGIDGYPEPRCATNSYLDAKGNGRIENVSDIQIHATEQVKGADGIIASARDFADFYRALLGGQILKPESLELMQDFQPTDEEDLTYGLGLAHLETNTGTWLGHTGSTVGAGAFVFSSAERGVTVAAFTNVGIDFPSPLADRFYPELWNDVQSTLDEP
jgi:D-alanyl-D-alanine carboxypeptidase